MAQTTLVQLSRTLHHLKLTENKLLRNTKLLFREKSTKQKTASSVYRPMNIFDRKAKFLQRDRSALKEDYHLAEFIKEEVGWRTADRIFDIKRTFHNAVELGACRGYVSRHLTPDSVTKITLTDTSQGHLDKAVVGDGVESVKVVMDEENLDFPENTIDLLVSSLCLHWVNDLPGCFDRVMRCLKPDGVFLASVFGGDTLMELRQSLQLAENERLGGMHQRVSPFTRATDIGGLMTAAGFTLQAVHRETIVVWYPTAWEVMRDVRTLGEGNAALDRALRLNRDVQFAAAAVYDEMYGKDMKEHASRGVPASFEIINFVGWKPDSSQPAPMPRGTGEVSLKNLHMIDEIIQDKNEKKP